MVRQIRWDLPNDSLLGRNNVHFPNEYQFYHHHPIPSRLRLRSLALGIMMWWGIVWLVEIHPRHRISVVYAAEISGKKPIVMDRGRWRDGSVRLRNFSVAKRTLLCAVFFFWSLGFFYIVKCTVRGMALRGVVSLAENWSNLTSQHQSPYLLITMAIQGLMR